MLGLLQSDEELGVVCVPTAVRHGQEARARVSDVKVLIFKLSTVDGLSAASIVVCEVTSLKTQEVTQGSRYNINDSNNIIKQCYLIETAKIFLHRFSNLRIALFITKGGAFNVVGVKFSLRSI